MFIFNLKKQIKMITEHIFLILFSITSLCIILLILMKKMKNENVKSFSYHHRKNKIYKTPQNNITYLNDYNNNDIEINILGICEGFLIFYIKDNKGRNLFKKTNKNNFIERSQFCRLYNKTNFYKIFPKYERPNDMDFLICSAHEFINHNIRFICINIDIELYEIIKQILNNKKEYQCSVEVGYNINHVHTDILLKHNHIIEQDKSENYFFNNEEELKQYFINENCLFISSTMKKLDAIIYDKNFFGEFSSGQYYAIYQNGKKSKYIKVKL